MKQHCVFLMSILMLVFSMRPACAQNLVPNPSFELYDTCPTGTTSGIDYPSICTNWNAVCFSADYYNSCAASNVSVPQNVCGKQFAKTGNAYCGFWAYVVGNQREYIESQLINPLSQSEYCVEFYVSLADTMQYGIDKIGAYFSDSVVHPSTTYSPYFTDYNPQVENTTMMTDTVNWTKISGVFTSIGGESILTIGNFRRDTNTGVQFIQSSPSYPGAYYYIDDVSVEEVLHADGGPDVSIIAGDSIQLGNNPTENASYVWSPSTGLSDITSPNPKASPSVTTSYVVTKTQCSVVTTDTVTVYLSGVGITESGRAVNTVEVYPNPARDELLLHFSEKIKAQTIFNLYDLTGKLVRSYELKPGSDEQELDARNVQTGLYLYEVVIDGKLIKKDKVAIVK